MISFVDTKDECQELCDESMLCYVAVFDTWNLTDALNQLSSDYMETVVKNNKKFGRCQLGQEFDGRCANGHMAMDNLFDRKQDRFDFGAPYQYISYIKYDATTSGSHKCRYFSQIKSKYISAYFINILINVELIHSISLLISLQKRY